MTRINLRTIDARSNCIKLKPRKKKKEKWFNRIERNCYKTLDENESVNKLFKKTKQMIYQSYNKWNNVIRKSIETIEKPKIIIAGSKNNSFVKKYFEI